MPNVIFKVIMGQTATMPKARDWIVDMYNVDMKTGALQASTMGHETHKKSDERTHRNRLRCAGRNSHKKK